MKKSKKGLILKALLTAFVCAFACFGVVAVAGGEVKTGMSAPLTEKVKVGEVVEIPEYYHQDGESLVKANSSVIFPGGKVYVGNKFTASEPGKYTVEYSVNGKTVNTEYCSAVIGAVNLFKVNNFAEVDGVVNYAYKADDAYKGVAVNVFSGAVIEYEQEIAVSYLTKENLLFEAVVEPSQKGEADFKQMILTFSDAGDESNYFRVNVTDGHSDGGSPKHMCFVNAAATGQTAGGYNYDSGTPVWQVKDIYGTSVFTSFRAELSGSESEYSVKLYFDAEENALYTWRFGAKVLVADLDDVIVFSGTAWGGFKSKNIKLKVAFTDVKSDGGRVIFNEIGGIRLVADEIIDSEAPDVEIDLCGQSKAPNSLLGNEYGVFPYSVYDFYDSSVDVKVSVVHVNFYDGKESDVSVKDGKFVTDKLGTYIIRYVATDYSGNQTVKEIQFNCIAEADPIVMVGLPSDGSADVFSLIDIPSPTSIRAFGGIGDVAVTVKVSDPNGSEIEIINGQIKLEQVGDYKIVYKATDFSGQYVNEEIIVKSIATDSTLFTSGIVLPELLIEGFKYTIPEVNAKTCYGNAVLDCAIEYCVNGQTLGDDRSFVASGSTATVECTAKAAGVERDVLTSTFKVISGQDGRNHSAYFFAQNGKVTATMEEQGVLLSTDSAASVNFANKLQGEEFSLSATLTEQNSKFEYFAVKLIDAENSSHTVTLRFALDGDKVIIKTPFGQTSEFTSYNGYFKFNFNSKSGIVSDANNVAQAIVDKDDQGNDLTTFENGLYVKFIFEKVRATSSVQISSLNNQMLGLRGNSLESNEDKVGPQIEILGDITLKAKVGEVVTLRKARAFDVLNQVTSVTIRVADPDRQTLIAETNANKEMELKLERVGYYMVVYTAVDSVGRKTTIVRNIRVVDSTAPTLSVQFENVVLAVNSVVTLPTVSVSDDSGKAYCDIFVELPNSEIRLLHHYENQTLTSYLSQSDKNYPNSFKASDNSFRLEEKGKYVITVMAYDDNYNLTVQTFTVYAV